MSERPKTAVRIVDYAPPARLGELADLWVASWAKTLPAIDFEARRPWFLDHIAGLATAGAAIRLAITDDGRAAGFVTVDPATAYLDQICVGVAWWGGGVADALLAEARRLSPARLVLDVNKDNPRAVAFYERNGFRRIAEGVNPRSGLGTLKLEWTA
ncbi:GNAT family N-acetyltransferase [Methyloraptor flagellatus]|uniref:GNAT family N-acetyltransferase n=1 Tax=Methyloraptor flagellatus TaxID=3162530 RepID=A0AAU7XAL7_9HYPH